MLELDRKVQDPGLWDDPQKASSMLKQREVLQQRLDWQSHAEEQIQDIEIFWTLAVQETDQDLQKQVIQSIIALEKKVEKARLSLLFVDPEDKMPCFLSVQAGSGGTEAQDWSAMLMRMYTRWCERNGHKFEWLEDSPGEEVGFKSASIKIYGLPFPYGSLKGESGVHRLVRISPFDSNARRHTSFASVSVVPELDDSIEINLIDKDMRVDTYRASGAGGQHVNKTDSAVRITHLPTGTVVQCQSDRSQHKNRATALSMLRSKLYEQQKQQQKEAILKGREEEKGITWGQQIRSYVLQPYQMVKDLRTQLESGNPSAILDGQIDDFLWAFIKKRDTYLSPSHQREGT